MLPPLCPVFAVPVGHWHNVGYCAQCKADVFWNNNGACGDDECCGPNLDYCTVCGVEDWPCGADGEEHREVTSFD